MMTSKPLHVESRAAGPIMTNTFAVTDPTTGQWALIDPPYGMRQVWSDRLDAKPAAIYITHGHCDHTGGLAEALRIWPDVPVYVHRDSASRLESAEENGAAMFGLPYEPARATHYFDDGDQLRLGNVTIEVIHAPGHCPGSVLLRAGDQLFVGDVIFEGNVGRMDLPGGDHELLAETIREKVMTLPDDTIIYTGHGEHTTIGAERKSNYVVGRMLAGQYVG